MGREEEEGRGKEWRSMSVDRDGSGGEGEEECESGQRCKPGSEREENGSGEKERSD